MNTRASNLLYSPLALFREEIDASKKPLPEIRENGTVDGLELHRVGGVDRDVELCTGSEPLHLIRELCTDHAKGRSRIRDGVLILSLQRVNKKLVFARKGVGGENGVKTFQVQGVDLHHCL